MEAVNSQYGDLLFFFSISGEAMDNIPSLSLTTPSVYLRDEGFCTESTQQWGKTPRMIKQQNEKVEY